MQDAAKQFVQVRIVHLDHIERRGDAAVTLWDDQHRGTPVSYTHLLVIRL